MKLRMGVGGWLTTFAAVSVAFLWFALFRMGVVSGYVAIALLLATLVLTIWLAPYFSAVHPAKKANMQHDNAA